MTELESKIEALKAEHEKKLNEAILAAKIEAALPVKPDWTHVYKLYDREGSVKYNADSLAKVLELVEALPQAEAMNLVKGMFTSFYSEPWTEKQRDKLKEITSIFPYRLKVEPASHSNRCVIEWTSIVNSKRIDLSVETPLHLWSEFFTVNVKRKIVPGYNYVERTELMKRERLHHLPGAVIGLNHDVSTYAKSIRWAAGSKEYPNSFSIYWSLDTDQLTDARKVFAAFLKGEGLK